MNDNDLTGAPAAEMVRFFLCDNCKHVHFALYDGHDRPLAVASLDPDAAESLARELLEQIQEARE